MVKKIKKYLKFIVCCALILSLIAPSYAALSASDGSAFVTKAEFDSALADFNARLTTFEAGINSKIDSQVTSYLDRNGIWSGKDQDVIDVWGLFFGTMMAEQDSKIITNNCGKCIYAFLYDTDYTQQTAAKGNQPNFKLINNVSKSGLMCLQYDYTFNYGMHHWPDQAKNKTIWSYDNWKKMMRGEILLRNNSGTYQWDTNTASYWSTAANWTSYVEQIISFEQVLNKSLSMEQYQWEGKKEARDGNDYSYSAMHPAAPKIYYFFVDKDLPLYIRYYNNAVDVQLIIKSGQTNDRCMWQALTNIRAKVY